MINKDSFGKILESVRNVLGLSSRKKEENTTSNSSAFTLIELLIVIAIIGILAGILIAVINPVKQRDKANQAVMRSSVSKACLAAVACVNASTSGYCTNSSFTDLGVSLINGNPSGSVYALHMSSGHISTITGTMGSCVVTCNPNALGTNPVTVSGCLIQ